MFRAMLETTPEKLRRGLVFNPARRDRKAGRPSDDQVERVIDEIGEAARVKVNSKGKFATAHDLRRSFAQRLADAGLHSRDLMRVMRHRKLETTEWYYLRENRANMADRIAAKLAMCDRSQVEGQKARVSERKSVERDGTPAVSRQNVYHARPHRRYR